MHHYIVYDTETFKIHETFPACGRDLVQSVNSSDRLGWINVTHPRHAETLTKINAANNTNYGETGNTGFKIITTAYWYGQQYPDLPFKHNEEKPYSIGMRNSIITHLLEKRYKVMLEPLTDSLIIWISLHRFGQK